MFEDQTHKNKRLGAHPFRLADLITDYRLTERVGAFVIIALNAIHGVELQMRSFSPSMQRVSRDVLSEILDRYKAPLGATPWSGVITAPDPETEFTRIICPGGHFRLDLKALSEFEPLNVSEVDFSRVVSAVTVAGGALNNFGTSLIHVRIDRQEFDKATKLVETYFRRELTTPLPTLRLPELDRSGVHSDANLKSMIEEFP